MDLSRYAELFLSESREHLSAINHLLLELERAPYAAEPLSAIFRAVHTMKGMSATMGYTAVADLAHEMETLLDLVRRGLRPLSADVLDACFAAADALERAVDLSVEGREGEIELARVVERLRGLAAAPAILPSAGRDPRDEMESRGGAGGVRVRVRVRSDAPMKGVRALLALKRAESLGPARLLEPSLDAVQDEQFGGEATLSIETPAPAEEIARVIRAAGDIEAVELLPDGADAPPAESAPAAATADARRVEPAGDAGTAAESVRGRPARSVRIDLRRLDSLMNLIGELVITRGRLAEIARGIDDAALAETMDQATRLIAELQDEIMLSRMVPVWQVFDRFPRLVRDAARALGKEVELTVEGKEIELDRSMLDEIGDPIVHLLRNAVDHGIELPDDRRAAGKPPQGRLTLSAARERSSVVIRVADDGRGVDRARVLAKARATGMVDAAKGELTDEELLRIIARPGFSTAAQVTDISGRGVGIDAVVSRVRALGGSVEFRTAMGQGTTITLRLPVTLAILRALLARVADETYAVPITHVTETVAVDPRAVRTVRGSEVLVLRDDVLPLVRFRDLVRLPAAVPRPVAPGRDAAWGAGGQAIILEVGERRLGVVVDELAGQQDIVVKQFDAVRDGAAIFSGATILPDGSPALIVDVGSLI
ncbi:MAG TPA: chemotaxis protein CheA [Gemmatimonadaceae bacterium]|nr:chemotaxis protein CheA [Gemmatimonadaceae bacterium]